MSLALLRRPSRRTPPAPPKDELVVAAPPPTPAAGAIPWWTYLFPVVGGAGAMLFVLINPQPLFLVAGGLFMVASLLMGAGMFAQQRSQQRSQALKVRQTYFRHLSQVRERLDQAAQREAETAAWVHPAPEALWTIAQNHARVWERRREDADFLQTRVGLGRRPLDAAPKADWTRDASMNHDAICTQAALRLLGHASSVGPLPVLLPVQELAAVSLVGSPEAARDVARALVGQLATFHSPEDVRVILALGGDAEAAWEWAKWLPHADAGGGGRLVARDPEQLRQLLEGELETRRADLLRRTPAGRGELEGTGWVSAVPAQPAGAAEAGGLPRRAHLVLVVDGFGAPAALQELLSAPAGLGLTVVQLTADRAGEPSGVDARLNLEPGGGVEVEWLQRGPAERTAGQADRLAPRAAESLARILAPLRLGADTGPRRLVETVGLSDLLNVDRPEKLGPEKSWRERPLRDRLRVPLGIDPEGQPVVLDLKESALGGMGPHGLIVGATGSGKSELLRTIVTGLAVNHPPELLSLVLVDFKGGATFAGMSGLPHVAGLITNLQDDMALVDRMRDALYGEQLRRQELLRRAGNLDSVREYQELRASGRAEEPLPFLLVIVDEFGELLASRPEFIDLFTAMGRVGRSLGMHLLLASQRLDEGRLRGLESHLSYRIALRVFSAGESRAVLGIPDAYTLPPVPGSAYLKLDAATPQRFKVATASTPFSENFSEHGPPAVELFRARLPAGRSETERALAEPAASAGASTLQVVVETLRDAAPAVHQVWLPPLERSLTLDQLPSCRRRQAAGPATPLLHVPLGLVDRPTEQRKEELVCDFSGPAGHLAVVGAPQAGKSTLLRTLVASFALTHSPLEVQFYAVDFGGGGLQALDGLPHVGTVCGRLEPDKVRRVVGEMRRVLDRREQLFRKIGADSAQSFRALRSRGELPDEALGDVFLLIDNWAAFQREFEDLEPVVLDLAARGLGYALHLVVAANRWMEIRSNLRDNIGGRLELRLNEPMDSEVDRQLAAHVPAATPGRGLTVHKQAFQVALPRIDGQVRVDDLNEALQRLVAGVSRSWRGPSAPPARVLPARVPSDALPSSGDAAVPGVPVAIGEPDLHPVHLDLTGGDPHFVVFGDGESGKTNLLRTYLSGLLARSGPGQVAVALVDYRRTLLDVVPPPHLLAYAGGLPAAVEAVSRLTGILTERLPGPELSASVLRSRSWWSGPELVLVVDDYDLVVTPTSNPLMPLADFLAQGRDLGFHLVVARRAGGASRAIFEPVMQRLRELGTSGVLLSGDRQEGPLLGPYAPTSQPPGRGMLVRRGEAGTLIQVAWTMAPEPAGAEPAEEAEALGTRPAGESPADHVLGQQGDELVQTPTARDVDGPQQA